MPNAEEPSCSRGDKKKILLNWKIKSWEKHSNDSCQLFSTISHPESSNSTTINYAFFLTKNVLCLHSVCKLFFETSCERNTLVSGNLPQRYRIPKLKTLSEFLYKFMIILFKISIIRIFYKKKKEKKKKRKALLTYKNLDLGAPVFVCLKKKHHHLLHHYECFHQNHK